MFVTNLGLDRSTFGSMDLQEVHLIAVSTTVKASFIIADENLDVVAILNDHRFIPVMVDEDIVDPQMRLCGVSVVDILKIQDAFFCVA